MESVASFLCCENNTHPPLPLPNLMAVSAGRDKQMQIQDITCSREQIKDAKEVIVKVVGNRSSRVDGVTLRKGECYIARDGSLIEILVGDHRKRIKFKGTVIDSNKRLLDDCNETHITKKKKFSGPKWEEIDYGALLIFTSDCRKDSQKVAGFDLDGTLIKTKSGRVFPVDTFDWVIAHNIIKEKLNMLYNEDYKIVIFTNQNGIGRQAVNKNHFKAKIENIVRELNIPIEVYMSTRSTIYRKPAPGMWNALLQKSIEQVSIKDSFYVGDAAGRCAQWQPGKKKDFSNSDRLFAENIGLKFLTPEEYFFGKPPAPYTAPKFIPSNIGSIQHKDYAINDSRREVIIMVGGPGSGKSHFVKSHLTKCGYISFSRDEFKSNEKVATLLKRTLSSSKSKVVIDNTNPTVAARKKFIDICKTYNVPVRCFCMDTPVERCHHNNKFREFTDKSHEPISPIVINSFWKSLEEPSKEEGLEEIVHVSFVPEFNNLEEEKLYKMYLH